MCQNKRFIVHCHLFLTSALQCSLTCGTQFLMLCLGGRELGAEATVSEQKDSHCREHQMGGHVQTQPSVVVSFTDMIILQLYSSSGVISTSLCILKVSQPPIMTLLDEIGQIRVAIYSERLLKEDRLKRPKARWLTTSVN